jgi:hypothetical protein
MVSVPIVPASPGHIIYLSAWFVHEVGLKLCNCGALVLSAAYLYKAALRVGAIKNTWEDMELVIRLQSRTKQFMVEPYDGIASMHKCFGRALGIKPSTYRKAKVPNLPRIDVVQKSGMMMETDWPVMSILQDQNLRTSEPKWDDRDFVVGAAFRSLDRLKKATTKSECIDNVFKQYERTGRLTATQLMFGLKEVLIADDVDSKFDYIRFALSCYELLRGVIISCDPALQFLMGKEWKAGNTQPYEAVHAILCDAADRSHSRKLLQHALLFHAAKSIKQYVEERGDKFSVIARKETQDDSSRVGHSCRT